MTLASAYGLRATFVETMKTFVIDVHENHSPLPLWHIGSMGHIFGLTLADLCDDGLILAENGRFRIVDLGIEVMDIGFGIVWVFFLS